MTSNKPNDNRLKIILKQNRLTKPYETKLTRKSRLPDIHKENYVVLKPCCVKLKKIVTENTNAKTKPISSFVNESNANNAIISIPPNAMSYEDFRKFTNIETIVRNDMNKRLTNAEPYLKNIESYIRKYYNKHFVALNKWPKKLKLCAEYTLTLDNIDGVKRMNNNVCTVDKESDVSMSSGCHSAKSNSENIQHAPLQTDSSISCSAETHSVAAHLPDSNSVIECSETRTDQCIETFDPVSKDTLTLAADQNDVRIKQENNTDVTNADLEILRALTMQLKTEPDCPLPSSTEHLPSGGQSCSEELSHSLRLLSSQNQPVSGDHPVSDEHSISGGHPVSDENLLSEKNKEQPQPGQNIPSEELLGEKIVVEPSLSGVYLSSENHSSSRERQIYPETILKCEDEFAFEEPSQTESDIENNANNHNTTVPTTNKTNSDNRISSDYLCKSEPIEEPPEFLPSQTEEIIINDKEPTVENLFDEMMNDPEPLKNVGIKNALEIQLSNLKTNKNIITAGVYTIIHSRIGHGISSNSVN